MSKLNDSGIGDDFEDGSSLADIGLDLDEIKRLYKIGRLNRVAGRVGSKAAALWLILGYGREPTPMEYAEFVWKIGPGFKPLVDFLVDYCAPSSELSIQILLESEKDWSHPGGVLARPRPTMLALFEAFQRRKNEGDSSPEFLALGERLERASDLEVLAASRRGEPPSG